MKEEKVKQYHQLFEITSKDIQLIPLCIHRNKHFHFSSCERAQTSSLEPNHKINEGIYPEKGFLKQASVHQTSNKGPQVHWLYLSLPHQVQPATDIHIRHLFYNIFLKKSLQYGK